MKTVDILNLDCTLKGNKEKVNKILWKVKPIAKMMLKEGYKEGEQIPIEYLEKALQGICIKYKFKYQSIQSYYEGEDREKFVFYNTDVLGADNDWIGAVYGKTLWELVAKLIIKIYGEIRAKREVMKDER